MVGSEGEDMKTNELGSGSSIDYYFGRISQSLAVRTPRRSFLGRLGTLTIAAGAGTAVGGAGTALWAGPSSVLATCHDGKGACGSTSAYCGCTSSTQTCPSGTCECGCWMSCPHPTKCGSKATRFCDCCVSSGGCSSSCPCGPRCCFVKEWSGGCTATRVIRCRVQQCNGAVGCG
jgi:hypothetical protein